MKKQFGFDPTQSFFVPDDVSAHFNGCKAAGAEKEAAWNTLFADYEKKHPDLAADFKRVMAGGLPEGWESVLPSFTPADKVGTCTHTHPPLPPPFFLLPCFLFWFVPVVCGRESIVHWPNCARHFLSPTMSSSFFLSFTFLPFLGFFFSSHVKG